jgi:hypothetical protein
MNVKIKEGSVRLRNFRDNDGVLMTEEEISSIIHYLDTGIYSLDLKNGMLFDDDLCRQGTFNFDINYMEYIYQTGE